MKWSKIKNCTSHVSVWKKWIDILKSDIYSAIEMEKRFFLFKLSRETKSSNNIKN